MSYIDIYDQVRKHWENDSGGQSAPATQAAFGSFKFLNGMLSATIGTETKTVDLRPLIPAQTPDLHLKSVTPSADGNKLIFKIGESGNTTHDQTVEMNFKEQIGKLVGTPPAPYDDAGIKRRISLLEDELWSGKVGGTTFKEFEAKYIPKATLGEFENNTLVPIAFTKTFSKVPFVIVTMDLKNESTQRFAYLAGITTTGFKFATNYSPDVKGIWYQAYVVE
jgi:hypothetical protein|nr:MAG TPA: hypothetical protein [Caudoviricetes sp.]